MSNTRMVLYVCDACGEKVFVKEFQPPEGGAYEPDPKDTWCRRCKEALDAVTETE